MIGFGFAMRAIGRCVTVPKEEDAALFTEACELARELYPPYPYAPVNNIITFRTVK